jgi:predicted metal-dependent peptidase
MALLAPCDEHNWSEDDQTPGSDARALADGAGEVMQELFDRHLTSWGDQALGEFRAVAGAPSKEEFDWDTVLSRRLDSIIKQAFAERWAPSPRKIAWMYPDVLIPADQLLEQPRKSVLLAIDTSGSVTPDVMTRFLGLARGIPKDRVEVAAISFDTQAYEFDLWGKQHQLKGGGGTSFQCIEQFAQKRGRYPDLVVVLTDGFADRPTIKNANRWFWVLSEQSTPQYIEGIGQWAKIGAVQPV